MENKKKFSVEYYIREKRLKRELFHEIQYQKKA